MKAKLTPELAEILGAFIGDGWIQSNERSLYIAGNIIKDKEYYGFLSHLISSNLVEVSPKVFLSWHVMGVAIHKKGLIGQLIGLGFQKGKKSLVAKIPAVIMNSSNMNLKVSVVRGIYDSDGTFYCDKSYAKTSTEWKRTHKYSPVVGITSCSKHLLLQITSILSELGIPSDLTQRNKKGTLSGRNVSDSYFLRVRKKGCVSKWFELIGSNNPRHYRKYDLWKKQGYLP
ncbi:hypothetical protein JW711_05980 [Candidatus Woesearchaeota archaeon]|nr:hypothetical protein [Candidatus Woesearchaeota archaeon]